MELATDSPYASQVTGIDKVAVVQNALERYGRVAFAGNGAPDLDAALIVEPELRFARGWLADQLKRRKLIHRRFEMRSEIEQALP